MKRCLMCPQPVKENRRQFCSKACSAKSRGRDFYRAIGKTGGINRSEHLRPGQIAKLKELAKAYTEPWEAFRAGARWQVRRSNSTTYARGVRTGYAKGWEACVKELGRRIA